MFILIIFLNSVSIFITSSLNSGSVGPVMSDSLFVLFCVCGGGGELGVSRALLIDSSSCHFYFI